jgi:spermidine/putrescine-binding protein
MIDAGVPAKWSPAKEGTLSWVCGFALTSKAQNTDAAYALMNWQSSPEAQAIRAEDGYLVTNPKAVALASPDYPEVAGVETADEALPETYPPNYPDWVRAFQDFKAQ